MASVSVDEAMRRAIELARPRARHHQPQPGGRLRAARRRRRGRRARASTRTPAGRTPRSSRWRQAGRAGPGRHRRGHPGTLRPHRPHRPLQPSADPGRGRPGGHRRARPEPGRVRRRRHAARRRGRRSRSGYAASEAEAGNVAWLTSMRRGRPYVIWKYAATLDGRSAAADGTSMWITSEAARIDVHALRGTVDAVIVGVGHRARRRPPADRPQPARRQPGHPAAAAGGGRQPGRTPADARVRDGAAPHLDRHRRRGRRRPGRPGRPAGAARGAAPARGPRGAAGGRPPAGRRVPAPPAWSTRSSATSRRGCSAPARPRWSTPASPPSPTPSIWSSPTSRRIGPDLRITAAAPQEGGLRCSPASSRNWARSSGSSTTAGDSALLARTRPAGHLRRPARRLDRGQRRLPDRGRGRRRRASPPT